MMALSWGLICGYTLLCLVGSDLSSGRRTSTGSLIFASILRFDHFLPYFYVCFFVPMITHRCVRYAPPCQTPLWRSSTQRGADVRACSTTGTSKSAGGSTARTGTNTASLCPTPSSPTSSKIGLYKQGTSPTLHNATGHQRGCLLSCFHAIHKHELDVPPDPRSDQMKV